MKEWQQQFPNSSFFFFLPANPNSSITTYFPSNWVMFDSQKNKNKNKKVMFSSIDWLNYLCLSKQLAWIFNQIVKSFVQ